MGEAYCLACGSPQQSRVRCRSRAKERGHSYLLVNQEMHDCVPISETIVFDRVPFSDLK